MSSPSVSSRIVLLRNPRSHRNRGAAAEDAPGVAVHAPATREELAVAIARIAAADCCDTLIIDGGDGTLRDVLSCWARHAPARWPRFVLLPKGKTNALAIDIGLPERWPLEAALQAVANGKTVIRRPMLLERLDTPSAPALGFIVGAGVFPVATDAGQIAHRMGAFQGFAVGVTTAFGMLKGLIGIGRSPWRALYGVDVTIDGVDAPHSQRSPANKRYAAGFSTLDRFPIGMRPFGREAMNGEAVRFLLVDAPLRRVLARVPAIMAGATSPAYPALGIHRGAAQTIDLDLDSRFILDGEAFSLGSYRITPGPSLAFVVP